MKEQEKGGFQMKLSDKIIALRKTMGISQEELAEKLNLSRQAISRWEMGTALPDATNILLLSKLFGVTTDFLLNDEFESDNDVPKIKELKEDNTNLILFYLVAIEGMTLLIQFMSTMVLRNMFFAFTSFLLFLAPVGGFEYAYRKKGNKKNTATTLFRKRFYKISAWLGLYFPVRFFLMILLEFDARPFPALVFECVVLASYLCLALLANLAMDHDYLNRKQKG